MHTLARVPRSLVRVRSSRSVSHNLRGATRDPRRRNGHPTQLPGAEWRRAPLSTFACSNQGSRARPELPLGLQAREGVARDLRRCRWGAAAQRRSEQLLPALRIAVVSR